MLTLIVVAALVIAAAAYYVRPVETAKIRIPLERTISRQKKV